MTDDVDALTATPPKPHGEVRAVIEAYGAASQYFGRCYPATDGRCAAHFLPYGECRKKYIDAFNAVVALTQQSRFPHG